MKKILVLGSAGKKQPNAITVDISAGHNPDIVHDLNKFPYPFKDNEFEFIS